VALKKPSEYFKKEKTPVDISVQELVKKPELDTFSDAFESFKKNLSKIEVLSEFSDTLDNYRVNIERVNHLSEKVEDIQTEIQTLLKKEDLDRAMMSQLIVVEQSICNVQGKVKGINEKNLTEIRLDVAGLTESVNEFLEIEVPKYKKLVVDAELRTNGRYEQLEESVNQTLSGIGEFVDNKVDSVGEFVDKKYNELTQTLQGINEDSLSGIIEDFNILNKTVSKFKEEDIPKYKGFIVETERKAESKLEQFNEKLDETVSDVLQKINSVENKNSNIENKVIQKIEEVQNLQKRVNNGLNSVEEKKEELTKKVSDLEVEIIRNESHIKTHKEELTKKVSDLEVEIIRNESHIKTQTDYIENIQEEVRDIVSKLQIENLEEKNLELSKKIEYLEEVFEKFNSEKLSEGLLNEPPEIENADPLTALDKNYVTLNQLQEHYRLFINRIQQQLATIGGGGETRLKYLDDIVGIATNASAYNGKFLKYDHGIGKFEFVTVSGGGGSGESYWTQGVVGIVTTSNVGINTNNPTSTLTVDGDVLVSGIVTATDFNSASDINLKENVSVISDPIDKIIKLEGVNFQWKENGKKSLGVIAQEVEKIVPELVSGEESKTVNYNGLVGLLIECVKQQQKEIEELKVIVDSVINSKNNHQR
jgi:hypothetical protein